MQIEGRVALVFVQHSAFVVSRSRHMAVFTYKATAPAAAMQSGTIAADTPRQARDLLRERGLSVQHLDTHRASSAPAHRRLRLRGKTKPHEVTAFIRELSTLLGVGVPLLEALTTISRQH